jgi:hypothetical protein
MGSWVGPRAGLDAVVKRKIPSSCRESNPPSSSPQPSDIPLSYPGYYVRKIKMYIVLPFDLINE